MRTRGKVIALGLDISAKIISLSEVYFNTGRQHILIHASIRLTVRGCMEHSLYKCVSGPLTCAWFIMNDLHMHRASDTSRGVVETVHGISGGWEYKSWSLYSGVLDHLLSFWWYSTNCNLRDPTHWPSTGTYTRSPVPVMLMLHSIPQSPMFTATWTLMEGSGWASRECGKGPPPPPPPVTFMTS